MIGAKKRRKILIQQFGGCCQKCGYRRCQRALQFHHQDSTEKKDWSRHSGRASVAEIQKHPDRFVLLCANCHFEEHDELEKGNHLYTVCPACQKQYRTIAAKLRNGKKPCCSLACRDQIRSETAISSIGSRLWDYIQKTPNHWLWTGPMNGNVPSFYMKTENGNHATRMASRVVYETTKGPLRSRQIKVIRTCEEPSCVNPDHATTGTSKEMMAVCVAKGRTTRGERAPNSKLTEDRVAEIRRRYNGGGVTQQELADEIGVSRQTIGDAITGKRWAHVT